MAESKGKVHIYIDQIENGYEVSCSRDEKPSLSKRAGWIPSCCGPSKKYSFKTIKEVLDHIKKFEEGK